MTRPTPLGRVPRGVPQRSLIRSGVIPAPIGGINAIDAATAMGPTDAYDLVNMVAGRGGLVSRLGYVEWVTGMTNPVRTVVPFKGSTDAKDALFACNSDGIWECTASTTTPTKVFSWGSTGSDAGWCIFQTFVTSAGHFILLCDEVNGYHLYTESTATWTKVASGSGAGQINGCDPGNFVFVSIWKNRVAFVERDTGNWWYLPVGVFAGTVSAMRLGNRFQHGGELRGAWSMTIDGGQGVDDFLAFVSGGGDVLLYQGTDPATAGAFENVGSWFVGAIPKGRRIATDFGGDLLILSLLGIVPLSKLRTGTFGPDLYATKKIANLFASEAAERRTLEGWSLRLSPEDNALLVNMPLVGDTYEQMVLSLATGGWSMFRGVPSLSSDVWKGSLYFGTVDGRLCKATGDVDGTTLTGTAGSEIDWSGITAFQAPGGIQRKSVKQIKPLIRTNGATPGYSVEARYDFQTAGAVSTPTAPAATTGAAWDVAVWDGAVWPGEEFPCGEYRGAFGSGMHMAVAFRGLSNARVTLLGFNVQWTDGGLS